MSDETRPLPCTNVRERTVRQWFAKMDEELNEVKSAVLDVCALDDTILDIYPDDLDKRDISLECADLITVMTSFQHALGISASEREMAQALVNTSNFQRGRM